MKALDKELNRLMRLLDVGLEALRHGNDHAALLAVKEAYESALLLPRKTPEGDTTMGYQGVTDKVTIPPTLDGSRGRAWRVDLAKAHAAIGADAKRDATIDLWIVEAIWAHPAWHSYVLTLVHLRPMPGLSEPKVYLPGATHEFWIAALDPAFPRDPMIRDGRTRTLTPLNFAAQIIEPADDLAQARVYCAVTDIIAGKLSPDTDYMRVWAALFGDNMMRDRF